MKFLQCPLCNISMLKFGKTFNFHNIMFLKVQMHSHIKVIMNKMTMHFTRNYDLILFNFNMKKLIMFNFLHIKMMKISFEIIRHHCFVLVTTRNLHTCVCFYINIHLNKSKSLVQQNLKIVFQYSNK